MNLYTKQLHTITQQILPWYKLQDKSILISGATGMLGKCLIDVLMTKNRLDNTNIRVIALSRNEDIAKERLREWWRLPELTYYPCDINEGISECGETDFIIHAASNTHPKQYATDPIGTITSNVLGTKNLLDYAVKSRSQRFCFLSSVEVYGENSGDVEKFGEDYLGYLDCNTLRAGYPESKRLGEALCNAYAEAYGISFVIPRLSRLYGPTMLPADTKALSQFIRKAAAGEDIVLKSEGNQKYSYTFITDAVNAVLHILLFGEDKAAYNVADEASDTKLRELAAMLAQISGTEVVFELPEEIERKGYSAATKAMLDAGKLQALGWQAKVHLPEGLRCTVESLKAAGN